jgi:hypothetical protein
MQKNPTSAWYELTSEPGPDGRVTRYYKLTCACGQYIKHRAGDFSDEMLRKIFIKKKWDVGKRPNQHRCPICAGNIEMPPRETEKRDQPSPPPPPPILFCSFCGKSQNEVGKLVAGPKAWICNECIEVAAEIVGLHRPQLPVPVEANSMASSDELKDEAAAAACHEFQHGSHIDNMPMEHAPLGTTEDSEEREWSDDELEQTRQRIFGKGSDT